MKVIILNSGIGRRMGKLVKDKPKCLVNIINNDTLLGEQLKISIKYGLEDVIITTGPFEEKIKGYVKKNFPDLDVKYVHNPKYDSTNYIYSLFLAREFIDDDAILMHGDMVFEEDILKNLIYSKEPNLVPLDEKMPPPKKDFKGRVTGGIIKEIGVNVFGDNCLFLAPIYKISRESFSLWLEEISKFVQRGDTNVYAENAFNKISSKINLKPLFYSNKICMEVDNTSDLEKARKLIKEL